MPLLASATDSRIKGKTRIDSPLNQTARGRPAEGSAQIQINTIELQGARVVSMLMPDLDAPELRGIIKIRAQSIFVDNLAIQGNGIYLRLNGNLPVSSTSPLNLNLELIPTAEFLEKQKSLFLLMLPYQTTPGSYRLPIGGSISSPQLAGSV